MNRKTATTHGTAKIPVPNSLMMRPRLPVMPTLITPSSIRRMWMRWRSVRRLVRSRSSRAVPTSSRFSGDHITTATETMVPR